MYEEIEMNEIAKWWYTEELLECLHKLGFEAVIDSDVGSRMIGENDGMYDFVYNFENGDMIGLSLDIGFNSHTNNYIGEGYELDLQLKDGTFRAKTFKRQEELIKYMTSE